MGLGCRSEEKVVERLHKESKKCFGRTPRTIGRKVCNDAELSIADDLKYALIDPQYTELF